MRVGVVSSGSARTTSALLLLILMTYETSLSPEPVTTCAISILSSEEVSGSESLRALLRFDLKFSSAC